MADSPFKVEQVQEEVPAQVSPQALPDTPDKVQVDEVHVSVDEVILDPTSDLAVQVPEEASSAKTPLHGYVDAKTPEEVFAEGDSEEEPVSEPAAADDNS